VGVYYFSAAWLLFEHARAVMDSGERHNGEFYVSALIRSLVLAGKSVRAVEVSVDEKHMLGTPEELQIFLDKVDDGRVVL
jgi:hypothetical protein